jgi:hypothetical protein
MDFAREGAQGHQRGEDTLAGFDEFLADRVENVFDRQHRAKGDGAIQQKPPEQTLQSRQSSTSDRMQHGRPPRRLSNDGIPSIKDEGGLSCPSLIAAIGYNPGSGIRVRGSFSSGRMGYPQLFDGLQVEPHTVANDLGWEEMAFVGIGSKSCGHTASMPHKAGAEEVANLI